MQKPMQLGEVMPNDFPPIYKYADKFWTEVDPRFRSLLNRHSRRLNLSQTIGTAYSGFQPFLLDYPEIRILLSKTVVKNRASCEKFWNTLRSKSIKSQFSSAHSKLQILFEKSKVEAKQKEWKFRPKCEMQRIAYESVNTYFPKHNLNKVFDNAFSCTAPNGRTIRIEQLQKVCLELESRHEQLQGQLLHLYNLIVYKHSLAYHCYFNINKILDEAYQHALGTIKIIIPNDSFIYRKWSDVMVWYGAYEHVREHTNFFLSDDKLSSFFITTLGLRDVELKRDAVKIKKKLLESYLDSPLKGKEQLAQVVQKFPFAAPYWVKQYLKLDV